MNLEKMCEMQIQYYNWMQAILAKEQRTFKAKEKEIGDKHHRDVKPTQKPYDTRQNLLS